MLKIKRKHRDRVGQEKLPKELAVLSAPVTSPSATEANPPSDTPALHNMLLKLRNLAERIDRSAAKNPDHLKNEYLNLLDEMAKQAGTDSFAHRVSIDATAHPKNNKLTLYVFEGGAPSRQRDIEVTHHLKQTVRNLRVQAQNVMSANTQMLPADFSREAAALTDQWLNTPSGSSLTPDDSQSAKRLALSLLR